MQIRNEERCQESQACQNGDKEINKNRPIESTETILDDVVESRFIWQPNKVLLAYFITITN